jgi:ACS family pantothenate transporter-like MFS transporter
MLWLKHYSKLGHFTQAQVNTYPLGIQAMGITSNMLAAIFIDATGRRVPMGILACMFQLISTVILFIPNMAWGATMFAFYLAGTAYIVNPLLFGWANVICQRGGDDARRSVILTSMNAFAQILYTWWGIVLFPADKVPYWRDGYISMTVVIVLVFSLLWVVLWVSFPMLFVMLFSRCVDSLFCHSSIDEALRNIRTLQRLTLQILSTALNTKMPIATSLLMGRWLSSY